MEQTPQNPTPATTPTDVVVQERRVDKEDAGIIYYRWTQFIYWYASGGLRVTEDGQIEEVSATEFAKSVGVNRTTIYDWPKIIPNFKQHVERVKDELYGDGSARMNAVDRALFLKAVGGDTTAIEMLKRNHSKKWKGPTAKIEHEAGKTLADLMMSGRRRQDADRAAAGPTVDNRPAISAGQ